MTEQMDKYIVIPSRSVPVYADFDVVVCGAGPAGIAAALASARNGMKTLLIEKSGCLGGTWTAGLLCWIIDSEESTGIMEELKQELKSTGNGADRDRGFSYKPEAMKFILEQKCMESNVDFLLYSKVCDVIMAGESISHVLIETPGGLKAVTATYFIDCSGDGNLGALAGCGFDIGNTSPDQIQPMSMVGLISGIECNAETSPFIAHHENDNPYLNLYQELQRAGITPSYSRPTLTHLGNNLFVYNANHEYNYSSLDAVSLTRATVKGRLEMTKQVTALKSLGGIWKNIEIVATPEHIGVREGRRLYGLYTLSIDDLTSGRRFNDAICHARFCIDVHSTSAEDGTGISNYSRYKVKPYDIPLRSLISRDINNLLMAGRCISGDFLSHGSYRVTGNAVPMGEAAGNTAAEAIKRNISLKDIVTDRIKQQETA